ncbi:MAG: SulP family inorganic anion transporter [Flavobacteriaceae bacterium]
MKKIQADLSSSLIVFFVALPLCLGIALASNAPIMSGLIAGIVGGIIVGFLSGSQLGVSGPAAGLTVIVAAAIATLGSWENFLIAVILAGFIQLLIGYLRMGFIAYFFPLSVINGMLAGIGLLIILKQFPYALGYSAAFFGEEEFVQNNHLNTFEVIVNAMSFINFTPLLITIISLSTLFFWERFMQTRFSFCKIFQGPIIVVLFGMLLSYFSMKEFLGLSLSGDQLVNIDPVSFTQIFSFSHLFNSDAFFNFDTYKIAFVIAIVASLETLLCLEATDKLDPLKRISPADKELKAQGIGNMICGFIGGLPVTQVIVRSSANINFGAKTKLSAILHGFWLLLGILFLIPFLNLIPLSSLSAILIIVGYKLTKPSLYKSTFKQGYEQFIPFLTTIIFIIFTNLLTGISVGLLVGLLFSLYRSYLNSYSLSDLSTRKNDKEDHHIVLAEEVSFFNKAMIMQKLNSIPSHSIVSIDFIKNKYISIDVMESIDNFIENAQFRNISAKKINCKIKKGDKYV